MPIFFTLFVMLCLIISLKISTSQKHMNKITSDFIEKEKLSLSVKSKDISTLPYISLQTILPKKLSEDYYLSEMQKKLIELSDEKILNLTGYTNTELRYMYGTSNLTFLIDCDTNFTRLSILIHKIGKRLYEIGDIKSVKQVYEFAVEIRVDISDIYLTLSHIYLLDGTPEKIPHLIEIASHLPSLPCKNVSEKLATSSSSKEDFQLNT